MRALTMTPRPVRQGVRGGATARHPLDASLLVVGVPGGVFDHRRDLNRV